MTSTYQLLIPNTEQIPFPYEHIEDKICQGDLKYGCCGTLTSPVVNPIKYKQPCISPPCPENTVRKPYYHPTISRYSLLGNYSTNPYPPQ